MGNSFLRFYGFLTELSCVTSNVFSTMMNHLATCRPESSIAPPGAEVNACDRLCPVKFAGVLGLLIFVLFPDPARHDVHLVYQDRGFYFGAINRALFRCAAVWPQRIQGRRE
jgi:hypothetical protein